VQNELHEKLLRPVNLAYLAAMKDILETIGQIQLAKQLLQDDDSAERCQLMRLESKYGAGMGFTIRFLSTKLHHAAFLL